MPPLGSPDLSAIAPVAVSPQPDRAPDSLASGTPEALRRDLTALLGPDRVLARPIDLIRYATDASPYRLFPKVVVVAQDAEDVRKVLAFAGQRHESVTFRAAGTSLSGQAQGDGILVDVRRHWSGVNVEAEGRRLRARPGTILSRGNAALVPYGYRIGPDPASASACTIGGVIANNSSGMCCGTTQNSYKTLRRSRSCCPPARRSTPASPDAEQRFAAAEPALAAGLARDQADDRIGSGPCRPPSQEVPHQEHDRLPHGGIPRRCDAVRDLPPADRRVRRDARLHRRGGLRHDPRRSVSAHVVHDLPGHVRSMCRREALRRQRRGRRGTARSRIAARRRRQARRARSLAGAARYRDRAARRVPSADRSRSDGGLAHRHGDTVRAAPAGGQPRSRKTRKVAAQFWNVRSGLLPSSAARAHRDRLSSSRTFASRRSGSPTARSTWRRCSPSTTTRASSSATRRRATCTF